MAGTTFANTMMNTLQRLATTKDINEFFLDSETFPQEEREAAKLLSRALRNCQSATRKDQHMRDLLLYDALVIARWEMEIISDDLFSQEHAFKFSTGLGTIPGHAETFTGTEDIPTWIGRLHEEDRHRTLQAFENHVSDRTGQIPYDCEYRMRMIDGTYRRFRSVAFTMRSPSGKPLRVHGAIEDITSRKHQQNMLESIMRLMSI